MKDWIRMVMHYSRDNWVYISGGTDTWHLSEGAEYVEVYSPNLAIPIDLYHPAISVTMLSSPLSQSSQDNDETKVESLFLFSASSINQPWTHLLYIHSIVRFDHKDRSVKRWQIGWTLWCRWFVSKGSDIQQDLEVKKLWDAGNEERLMIWFDTDSAIVIR
jgi:hypothetical protein